MRSYDMLVVGSGPQAKRRLSRRRNSPNVSPSSRRRLNLEGHPSIRAPYRARPSRTPSSTSTELHGGGFPSWVPSSQAGSPFPT